MQFSFWLVLLQIWMLLVLTTRTHEINSYHVTDQTRKKLLTQIEPVYNPLAPRTLARRPPGRKLLADKDYDDRKSKNEEGGDDDGEGRERGRGRQRYRGFSRGSPFRGMFPNVPITQGIPGKSSVPDEPYVPGMSRMPGMLGMPGMSGMSGMLGMSGLSGMNPGVLRAMGLGLQAGISPGAQGMPQARWPGRSMWQHLTNSWPQDPPRRRRLKSKLGENKKTTTTEMPPPSPKPSPPNYSREHSHLHLQPHHLESEISYSHHHALPPSQHGPPQIHNQELPPQALPQRPFSSQSLQPKRPSGNSILSQPLSQSSRLAFVPSHLKPNASSLGHTPADADTTAVVARILLPHASAAPQVSGASDVTVGVVGNTTLVANSIADTVARAIASAIADASGAHVLREVRTNATANANAAVTAARSPKKKV